MLSLVLLLHHLLFLQISFMLLYWHSHPNIYHAHSLGNLMTLRPLMRHLSILTFPGSLEFRKLIRTLDGFRLISIRLSASMWDFISRLAFGSPIGPLCIAVHRYLCLLLFTNSVDVYNDLNMFFVWWQLLDSCPEVKCYFIYLLSCFVMVHLLGSALTIIVTPHNLAISIR